MRGYSNVIGALVAAFVLLCAENAVFAGKLGDSIALKKITAMFKSRAKTHKRLPKPHELVVQQVTDQLKRDPLKRTSVRDPKGKNKTPEEALFAVLADLKTYVHPSAPHARIQCASLNGAVLTVANEIATDLRGARRADPAKIERIVGASVGDNVLHAKRLHGLALALHEGGFLNKPDVAGLALSGKTMSRLVRIYQENWLAINTAINDHQLFDRKLLEFELSVLNKLNGHIRAQLRGAVMDSAKETVSQVQKNRRMNVGWYEALQSLLGDKAADLLSPKALAAFLAYDEALEELSTTVLDRIEATSTH